MRGGGTVCLNIFQIEVRCLSYSVWCKGNSIIIKDLFTYIDINTYYTLHILIGWLGNQGLKSKKKPLKII